MAEYIALQPIDHGSVRAYNPGDPVPAANVDGNGYVVGEQVAEIGSGEAQARLAQLGMIPADEPGTVAEAVEEEATGPGEDFDPAAHTIAEVNAWLAENPDATPAVLKAEWDGKGRAGILHGPHGTPPDVAEA